jgi:hypothetical protein
MPNKPAPFDWMEPRRNADRAKIEKTRRESMYRSELEDRAALLQRLGYGRDRTRARLAANLAWDFQDGGSPLDAAAVDAIVDKIFNGKSESAPGRAAPRGKGGAR